MTAPARSINELTLGAHVVGRPVKGLALPLISGGSLWAGLRGWLLVMGTGDLVSRQSIKRRSR